MLTKAEYRCLILAASGKTNKEIAKHLKVKPTTVRTHLNRVYSKLSFLGVRGRTDLPRILAVEEYTTLITANLWKTTVKEKIIFFYTKGLSTKEIAQKINSTPRRVYIYLSHILRSQRKQAN